MGHARTEGAGQDLRDGVGMRMISIPCRSLLCICSMPCCTYQYLITISDEQLTSSSKVTNRLLRHASSCIIWDQLHNYFHHILISRTSLLIIHRSLLKSFHHRQARRVFQRPSLYLDSSVAWCELYTHPLNSNGLSDFLCSSIFFFICIIFFSDSVNYNESTETMQGTPLRRTPASSP